MSKQQYDAITEALKSVYIESEEEEEEVVLNESITLLILWIIRQLRLRRNSGQSDEALAKELAMEYQKNS